MKIITRALSTSILSLGALSFTLTAQAAPHFGGRSAPNATTSRTGTYQTLRHGNGTFSQTVTRANGTANGTTTWTNARGQTDTRTFTDSWNKAAGTGTVSSSTQYANGRTSSSQGTWTKTGAGDSTYSGTHTGRNGQVTDVSKSVTDVNGVKTVDTTDTRNGQTRTSDQTYAKTSDGYTRTGTVAGYTGATRSDNDDVSFTKDANGDITRTMAGSVTGPNGRTKIVGNSETYSRTVTPNPASGQ